MNNNISNKIGNNSNENILFLIPEIKHFTSVNPLDAHNPELTVPIS